MWTYTNSDELYHYGVKGMKWGVRNKKELKVAKKYAKAGRYEGDADYARSRGDAAAKKYLDDANVLDRQADAWEKDGKIILAEATRLKSNSLKELAAKARAEFDEEAREYSEKASRLRQKANDFATKQKIDLGKDLIDSILKSSREEGFNRARSWDYDEDDD